MARLERDMPDQEQFLTLLDETGLAGNCNIFLSFFS